MLADVESLLPDLRVLYEDLHAHPELSFAEHRTAAVLAGHLEALGYEVSTGVGRTGVVATLSNGDGPTVLLRADFDALPVLEDTGLPYASTVTAAGPDGVAVPVAHACGHDMHATWMIGVATWMVGHREAWSGTAMLVLQPAEELGTGAQAMVEDGLFDRFGTPVVALGQHVVPAPAGWVLSRTGPMMSASDSMRIVLHGRGGHGSAPEQTVDPIVMAASTVMKLQTVVSREISATDTAVVTVGTFHAGTKENIIPDRAELGLTIRTFVPAVRDQVLRAIGRIVDGEASAAGAPKPPEVALVGSFPIVDNDAAATGLVASAFADRFGSDRALEAPMATASEDFGLFGSLGGFPSVFWFVGGADAERWTKAFAEGRLREDIPSNHSPHYAPVQDPTIAAGIEAMVTAALCWLGR